MEAEPRQPRFVAKNDGHDEARRAFYNLRETALSFGMPRDEFNRRAALAGSAASTPEEWLEVGRAVHDAAMREWCAQDLNRRQEAARRRAENQKSFRDEAERRAKRFAQLDRMAGRRAA